MNQTRSQAPKPLEGIRSSIVLRLNTKLFFRLLGIYLGTDLLLAVLCLGGLTPPVGLCLITTSRIVDVDIDKMFPDLLWCIGIYVLVIALVAVFPGLATWLPSMMA